MIELLGKIVASLASTPWALVVVAVAGGLVWLIIKLSENTELTKAVVARIGDGETAKLVKEIRADQLVSNRERAEQGRDIADIKRRLDAVENDVRELKR